MQVKWTKVSEKYYKTHKYGPAETRMIVRWEPFVSDSGSVWRVYTSHYGVRGCTTSGYVDTFISLDKAKVYAEDYLERFYIQ